MSDRSGKFAGNDPFRIARDWLEEAEATEINDANAIALATTDAEGLPNVRMVLLKEIEADAFVFYTNYGSAKAAEIEAAGIGADGTGADGIGADGAGPGKAAFVMHWKSLRRQIRVRGLVSREAGEKADEYYASRSLKSRLGAWASHQSQPLESRTALMAEVARLTPKLGTHPPRPAFWGGYRITPLEIEFWADGAFRLHDRFRWRRATPDAEWEVVRLNP